MNIRTLSLAMPPPALIRIHNQSDLDTWVVVSHTPTAGAGSDVPANGEDV